MNFDGPLTIQGAGARVVLTTLDGDTIKYAIQLGFRATNNMAEYEGLQAGLRVVLDLESAAS